MRLRPCLCTLMLATFLAGWVGPAVADSPEADSDSTRLAVDPQQELFDLVASKGYVRISCFGGILELYKQPGRSLMRFTFWHGDAWEMAGYGERSDLQINFRDDRLVLTLSNGVTDHGTRRTVFDYRNFVVPLRPEWKQPDLRFKIEAVQIRQNFMHR